MCANENEYGTQVELENIQRIYCAWPNGAKIGDLEMHASMWDLYTQFLTLLTLNLHSLQKSIFSSFSKPFMATLDTWIGSCFSGGGLLFVVPNWFQNVKLFRYLFEVSTSSIDIQNQKNFTISDVSHVAYCCAPLTNRLRQISIQLGIGSVGGGKFGLFL